MTTTTKVDDDEQEGGFEVVLAIYDLSRGMARQLSAQFLGLQYAIDAIPHTGIVVYGLEYFFGSGIQNEDPYQFRQDTGMYPIQTITIGKTDIRKEQFELWCQIQMQNTYHPTSYDLLTRNCNNFCYDAITQFFHFPSSVFPSWILNVPQTFLSSPMGQLVRPMLQNMQIVHPNHAHTINNNNNNNNNTTTSSSTYNNASSNNNSSTAIANPWANLESQNNNNETTTTTKEKTPKDDAQNNQKLETPLLDSFTKPLLSKDTNTIDICIQKITTTNNNNENSKNTLQDIATTLKKPDNNETLTHEQVNDVCTIILNILKDDKTKQTFALMLLRLVVLHCPNDIHILSNNIGDNQFTKTIQWIISQIQEGSNNSNYSTSSHTMMWLTLSNAVAVLYSHQKSVDDIENKLSNCIEAAITVIQNLQQRTEIRQAACAFLYNVTLLLKHDEDETHDCQLVDIVVSILCAILEGLDDETDSIAKLRRLMVLGRILKPQDERVIICQSAKNLINDLGFTDSISSFSQSESTIKKNSNDTIDKQCEQLLKEIVSILQS